MVNHKKIKHSVPLSRGPALVQSMIALHLLIYKSDKEATIGTDPQGPPWYPDRIYYSPGSQFLSSPPLYELWLLLMTAV